MTPTRVLDTQRLATLAHDCERDLVHFLRELAIPSLAWRIQQEMARVGFSQIQLDPLGNILGRIGSGSSVLMVASQIDGPGAAGMACAVYAGKLLDELGMYDDFTLWVAGFRRRIFQPTAIQPEALLITEPTNLRIYCGALPGSDDSAAALHESHPLVEAAIGTYEALFELPPLVGKRPSYSVPDIPVVAFGPGDDESPHAGADPLPVRHLVKAAQFYAAFPTLYVDTARRR